MNSGGWCHRPTIRSALTGFVEGAYVRKPIHDPCHSIIALGRVAPGPSGFSSERTPQIPQAMEPASLITCKEVPQ